MAPLSRSPRRFRGDARFAVGIVLVLASIGGVWFVLTSSDQAVPVLQARRTIARGEVLRAADLETVDVALGAVSDEYLRPDQLPAGQVAVRTLTAGELVPRTAMTAASDSRTTTVVVESSVGLPEDVAAGTEVEIWQAPLREDGRSYDEPRILVGDVVVRAVLEPEGLLAENAAELEIVIDRSDVAAVLAAVTGGAALSVVPVGAGS
ncbi:SAF domain-containing protein [Microbacterium paraoxydans]|uniref:SAF domain-containing protein n=1 Tax=Microbacterium paraoxydans TaxID=199592 RepID=UPI0021A8B42A|nr:SAF domain-containing protein [Microbacterium paraoxydans]MCT2225854.1 SAF domain-containing protein [Microbacterium paraoxydans]